MKTSRAIFHVHDRGEGRAPSLARWAAGLLLVLAVDSGCGAAEDAVRPVAVRVETVAVSRVADVRGVVGTVHARVSATVAAQVMATVEEVPVRAGTRVASGQLLARLDDAAAAAEYQRADADRRRYEALLSRQAATRAEYEAVIARYRVAEATLGHTRVTSPMEGVVAQRFVDPGDMATPGKPLFIVEQPGAWRLEAQVPERLGTAVREGDSLAVHLDADSQDCAGTVAEVVPMADPLTRDFTVKIDLSCPTPPRSGAFGRAEVAVAARDAIVVPDGAVHERGQLTYVFVEADGHARMRLVRSGRPRAGTVEILAGLAAGDRVVVSADGELVDGRSISVAGRP